MLIWSSAAEGLSVPWNKHAEAVPGAVGGAVDVRGEVHLLVGLIAPRDADLGAGAGPVEGDDRGDVVAVQVRRAGHAQGERRAPVGVSRAAVVDHHLAALDIRDPQLAVLGLLQHQRLGSRPGHVDREAAVEAVGLCS